MRKALLVVGSIALEEPAARHLAKVLAGIVQTKVACVASPETLSGIV